jgi:putative glutamine amidotransferase
LFGFLSCQEQEKPTSQNPEKLIAISWFYPNHDYQNWLSSHDENLCYVNIYETSDDSIGYYLNKASGFVLTGGCDIHPARYGAEDELSRCGKTDMRRDSLEWLMVGHSFASKTPILGVCRGMQVMNVVGGGNLIIDLPEDRNTKIHQVEDGDAYHSIYPRVGSYLFEISSIDSVIVNSNHHQGLDQIAKGYSVLATAPDSIVEAIIWDNRLEHPFALAVGWHPERLERTHPMSQKIARDLLEAIDSYFAQNSMDR